ncbi:MAG: toxin-activating lysine-acyltransferase [Alphaproteobacteria bacterium]|nr:toxin-activating lysine-acyltransferase [Alphaproteobacteria bacterium]
MPPMLLNQFRIFKNGNQPLGFALWAHLAEEVESRLTELNKKAPNEWQSGDRLWLIELVSPFHTEENKLNESMTADLAKNVFKGKKFTFLQKKKGD